MCDYKLDSIQCDLSKLHKRVWFEQENHLVYIQKRWQYNTICLLLFHPLNPKIQLLASLARETTKYQNIPPPMLLTVPSDSGGNQPSPLR